LSVLRRPLYPDCVKTLFYQALLLDGGLSIRAVSEYLGHHDPGFTLRTYAHLMPESEDRARDAIDTAHSTPAKALRNAADAER
jgi:hypothetical protein